MEAEYANDYVWVLNMYILLLGTCSCVKRIDWLGASSLFLAHLILRMERLIREGMGF